MVLSQGVHSASFCAYTPALVTRADESVRTSRRVRASVWYSATVGIASFRT
jgi:hypothetical protein